VPFVFRTGNTRPLHGFDADNIQARTDDLALGDTDRPAVGVDDVGDDGEAEPDSGQSASSFQ
jgi:hypothetical protein